ncbi:MAG: SDR family oxidoreductase [Bryobacteraceae bacterium]|nr:SDR family oxidoreductase [Bryobacteraceae bacterium]
MNSTPTALITGASAGIGAAFARRLAADGFDLILVARRRDRLEALSAELTANFGHHVEVLTADLATDSGIASVADYVIAAPRLDLLINNAGFGIAGRFYEVPAPDHDRMHRLHVMATLHLTHAALRRMVPIGHGSVINVSSVAGFTPSSGTVSYSATKHWMNSFTEGVWLDLKMRGSAVKVQALCPGFTYSEFHDVMGTSRSTIPKWLWTPADEVVDASLRALRESRLFVIPGGAYRALVFFSGLLPRSLVRAGAVWFTRNIRNRLS